MNTHKKLKGLAPIIDSKARVLILGSFPGPLSIKEQEYYAHPQNCFWKIIFDILHEPLAESYKDKTRLLKNTKIGLWDVIQSCHREGAADNNITDIELNDFSGFLKSHPGIKTIFTNGKKAYELFRDNYEDIEARVEYLPSTSPANAGQDYTYKKGRWKKILDQI